MTSKRKKLQEDTNFRVFRLLQESPEMSQQELTEAVGASVGGIHCVLKTLIEKGNADAVFSGEEDERVRGLQRRNRGAEVGFGK